MPMRYPPLADGTYRYGDDPQPLPSPIPGPDAGADPDADSGGSAWAGPHVGTGVDSGLGTSIGPGQTAPPDEPAPDFQRPKGVVAAASIVGGLGLVVVVILGVVLFGPGSGRGPVDLPGGPAQSRQIPLPPAERTPGAPFTVEGRFTVVSSPGEPVSGDGDGCDLPPTLSDIGEGTRITLVDGAATVLGSARLAYDEGDLSSCTFIFGFSDVPSGGSFYLIELAGRGQLLYTEDELRSGIEITLGR